MKRNNLMGIIAIILLGSVCSGVTAYFVWFRSQDPEQLLKAYQSNVAQLITDVRSTNEQWTNLLGGRVGGGSLIDLCGPVYAAQITTLGQSYITTAAQFQQLGNQERSIAQYSTYEQFFTAYGDIGARMVKFADSASQGEYEAAVAEIDEIVALYDTLPVVY